MKYRIFNSFIVMILFASPALDLAENEQAGDHQLEIRITVEEPTDFFLFEEYLEKQLKTSIRAGQATSESRDEKRETNRLANYKPKNPITIFRW